VAFPTLASLWYYGGMSDSKVIEVKPVHKPFTQAERHKQKEQRMSVNAKGTPSLYRDTFPQLANKYLSECNDRFEQFLKARTERGDTFGERLKVDLPTRTGLAVYLGVTEHTLQQWGKLHNTFLIALKAIDYEQKERLLNNGLSKAYDPTICKLLLAANHGISDKQVVEHQFTIKDMVEQREEVATVAWDDASAHLTGLAEAAPVEEESDQ